MPPYDMINKGWLKDILAGKKKLLKLRQVKLISVPKFDEVSVKNLYEKLLDLEGMSAYFPDKLRRADLVTVNTCLTLLIVFMRMWLELFSFMQ